MKVLDFSTAVSGAFGAMLLDDPRCSSNGERGGHALEIRGESGYDAGKIARLQREGIVVAANEAAVSKPEA